MRETITGVLHVIHQRKQPKGGLLEQYIIQKMQDAGAAPIDYWPPIYFVLTEETVADRHAVEVGKHRASDPFQFRFKGRPKRLQPDLRGHRITVKATVEPFANHLGGYLIRPEVVSIGDYVECPYHDDPYDDPQRGTARVYCKRPPVFTRVKEVSP